MPSVPAELQDTFAHIDSKREEYIKDLREYVTVSTCSIYSSEWSNVTDLLQRFEKRLSEAGMKTELVRPQRVQGDGDAVRPPIIVGQLGADPQKKTVLVYMHLDIHRVKMEKWKSDPFTLVEEGEKLIGRGVSITKGPAMCWLHLVESYKAMIKPPPVNFKFLVEGMYEHGSFDLQELCISRPQFFTNVNCSIITNTVWLGTKTPCIVYGHRGLCHFEVTVEGFNRELHSGEYGGVVCEPMSDLILLLNALRDEKGKICVPGFADDVLAPTLPEQDLYASVDFDIAKTKDLTGASRLTHDENKARILMHRWRLPCLTIHGVEGADACDLEKTIIPPRVVGKLSFRIVENQTPEKVGRCVSNYLETLWKDLGCVNALGINMTIGAPTWVEKPNTAVFQVARKAVLDTYNIEPDLIREGATIPIAHTLRTLTGKPLVMLCIGAADDNVQCPNEQIGVKNFMEGHKLVAAFAYEASQTKTL